MLQDLSSRKVTGNAAIVLVEETIGMYRLEDQWILNAIMERNLKIGLSLDNFDKVAGNTKKFEVALAHNLDKVKNVDPCDGTYFASRKLDGCRTICKINNYMKDQKFIQEVKFYSRSGKEFTTPLNCSISFSCAEPITKPKRILFDGFFIGLYCSSLGSMALGNTKTFGLCFLILSAKISVVVVT